MDKLRALKYFLEVAEKGSFSAAAKSLDVPASSVSRRIQDLEKSLGAVLIHRSTRVVKLTELGTLYLEQVKPAIVTLDYADNIVGHNSHVPSGILKITAAPDYGKLCLEPALLKLQSRYPEIVLDVELTDHVSNLEHNQVDIAIRATAHPPERSVARKLSNNKFLLVASPQYLSTHGTPKTFEDMQAHQTILYRGPNGVLNWQAKTPSTWKELQTSVAFISNQGERILQEALAGKGMALLPEWGIQKYLANQSLKQVTLQDAEFFISRTGDSGVYLLYHKPKYSVFKNKASIDFLISELSNI